MYSNHWLNHILGVFCLVFTLAAPVKAQEILTDHYFDTWWSNINHVQISKKWELSTETHIRRTQGLAEWQQLLIRPAINFQVNTPLKLSVGYTFIQSFPYGNQPIVVRTPENNVWEQLTLSHSVGRLKLAHRYRLEHRFIGTPVRKGHAYQIDGMHYAQRFRYRITGVLPFGKQEKGFAKFFDEAWIHLEDNLMPRAFNQNWLYLGLGYHLSSWSAIEVGYLHQSLSKGDGIHFESNPTLQSTLCFYL
jgi:hypothetical protein